MSKTKAMVVGTPESLISEAIKAGANVETMERLFALREKVKGEIAREAFVRALSEFQAECPTIRKTKKVLNRDGTVRYMYAPMDSVIEQIKKPLSEAELSYTWDSLHSEGHMAVICKLTHVLGHSETSKMEIPIESSQYMTSPQSYATAQSYAKRYTLLNVLGIGTAEEDTDATDTGRDKAPKSDKSKIIMLLRMLKEKNSTAKECEEAVKRLTGIELKEDNYGEIISKLEWHVQERSEA